MNREKGAIGYLLGLKRFGMRLGLENITHLLKKIGNPHKKWKAIHVAGTNGKGSVCAYISSILQEAGYRVGLYTSPHLIQLNERIRVNDVQISDDRMEKLAERIRIVSEEMVLESRDRQVTFFEFMTALAFSYFCEEKVDFGVLEVGIGGRLDATNVVIPEVCAITHLAIEHPSILGSSLDQIAREKSGIIKKGVPVVVADSPPPEPVKEMCRKMSSDMIVVGKDVIYALLEQREDYQRIRLNDMHDVRTKLLGKHQVQNAATAFGVTEVLRRKGYEIPDRAINDGFFKAEWPGRFQIVRRRPLVLLDAAHNPDAAKALRESVDDILDYNRGILILGMLDDKDVEGFVYEIYPLASIAICTKPTHERSMPAERLAEIVGKFIQKTNSIPDVHLAIEKALVISGEKDLVMVTGSNSTVGEAIQYFNKVSG